MNNFSLKVKDKVLCAINEYSMLENTDRLVAGVSGGADSLCLLHLLNSLKSELNYTLVAAHINHGIRGEEAKRDADFVEKFCSENAIEFNLLNADCPAQAKQTGESLEECGRRVRYEFFNSLSQEKSKIVTAHNSNDNAETVLFNIIRGASFNGACGIPPVRDNVIRPLILCSRDEIEEYCRENNLHFVTDSTNLTDDYTRNKIRHQILPVMQEINTAAINNIGSFSSSVKEVSAFVNKTAKDTLEKAEIKTGIYDVSILTSCEKSIVKQAIVLAFNKISFKSIDSKKVDVLYKLLFTTGRLQVFGDLYAEVLKNQFRFFYLPETAGVNEEVAVEGVPFVNKNEFFNIEIREYTNNSKKFNKILLDNLVDCDKIVGKIYLRTRRQGDTFTFYDRKVTKTLKKLFNELNIPVERRGHLPVLCDEKGIVWVYSVGTNARCRVDADSSNIIYVGGEDNDR